MKKKIVYLFMLLGLSLSMFSMPVFVQAQTSTETTTTNTTDVSTTTVNTESETSEAKKAREVRVGDYKKLLKETMTNALKARIAARCVPAQAQVKSHTTKNKKAADVRTTAYDTIVSNLEDVATSSAAKGADVTALEASITTLQANIETFKTANTAYQQTLTDLSLIDCKTDPTAFKAALEVARTAQIAVFNAAKTIRTHLTATIKPALVLIKSELESADK